MSLFFVDPGETFRLAAGLFEKAKGRHQTRQEDRVMTEKPETGRKVLAVFFVLFLLVAAMMTLGGCASKRSISNTGYNRSSGNAIEYHLELGDLAFLGIDGSEAIPEQAIQKEFKAGHSTKIKAGAAILVLQSGALLPDEFMLHAPTKHFKLAPPSGVPAAPKEQESSLARQLRMAAAQGGSDYVLCYW
jgi:hypothetical protein